VTFKSTYITYTLTTSNHVPSYGISPLGRGIAGECFDGDTFFLYGGCPLINDFDVMTPVGTTVKQLAYNAAGNNAAVVSKVTGNARVMISGFSFIYIRDDDENGVMDRTKHLFDIMVWMSTSPNQPTDTKPVAVNVLQQNYPNPFNPQTTIAFSVKERGPGSLKIYSVAGELVRTLANEEFGAGPHTKVWDGRDDAGQTVSSGVYFYRLVAKNFTQTRKMVALK